MAKMENRIYDYFVRHGHADYEQDCLTPVGRQQAQKVAQRLRDYGIQQIFATIRGRALETAQYTADVLNLPVIPCDFMKELSWRSIDGEPILACCRDPGIQGNQPGRSQLALDGSLR